MTHFAIPLSDMVVTAINAKTDYTIGPVSEAKRTIFANFKRKLDKITETETAVTYGSFSAVAGTRQIFDEDHVTRVIVASKVPKVAGTNLFDESVVESLLNYVGELITQVLDFARLNPDQLRGIGMYTNNPILDDEYMEAGIFLSMATIQFRAHREI